MRYRDLVSGDARIVPHHPTGPASALWDLVEPFFPIPPRRPKGGRPRVPDRACFTGILFVLRSGIPWQMLPHRITITLAATSILVFITTSMRLKSDQLE